MSVFVEVVWEGFIFTSNWEMFFLVLFILLMYVVNFFFRGNRLNFILVLLNFKFWFCEVCINKFLLFLNNFGCKYLWIRNIGENVCNFFLVLSYWEVSGVICYKFCMRISFVFLDVFFGIYLIVILDGCLVYIGFG